MDVGVQTPVTVGGLIIVSIFLIVVNFAPRIYDWLKLRAEIKERETQARRAAEYETAKIELEKDEKAWDTVVREYERALDRNTHLGTELDALRPLALANAILETKMTQCKEDKEDWKAHSLSLEEQLTQHNIVPRPFRRLQHESTDEIKTVSRKMKAIQENNQMPATGGSPTLILPTIQSTKKEGE